MVNCPSLSVFLGIVLAVAGIGWLIQYVQFRSALNLIETLDKQRVEAKKRAEKYKACLLRLGKLKQLKRKKTAINVNH